MTARELREQRARLIAQAQSRMDEITDTTEESRVTEIETEVDAMLTEAEGIEARASRMERLAAMQSSTALGDPRVPQADGQRDGQEPDAVAPTYRQGFHAWLAAGGVMSNMSEEMRSALATREVDPEARAQLSNTPAAGGNLIPDEMMQPLMQAMALWGPMYDDDVAMTINTEGGATIPIPTVDDTGNEAAAEASEGAEVVDDGSGDVTLGRQVLEDFMYITQWVRWSLQLNTSSMTNVEQLLVNLLGERLGRTANRQLTTGTGSGAPMGFLTASSLGHTAAGSASVTSDEIMNLIHSVDPAYRGSPKAGLQFNDNTLLAIHKLKDGDGNYLIRPGTTSVNVLSIGALSAKFRVNQAMPDMASGARSMAYGDFSRYFVRKIGSPIIGVMQDSKFWPGQGVAGYVRLDGVLGDAGAIKHLVHG